MRNCGLYKGQPHVGFRLSRASRLRHRRTHFSVLHRFSSQAPFPMTLLHAPARSASVLLSVSYVSSRAHLDILAARGFQPFRVGAGLRLHLPSRIFRCHCRSADSLEFVIRADDVFLLQGQGQMCVPPPWIHGKWGQRSRLASDHVRFGLRNRINSRRLPHHSGASVLRYYNAPCESQSATLLCRGPYLSFV